MARGLQKPSLTINSLLNPNEALFRQAVRDVYFLQANGAVHADFVATHWWYDPGGIGYEVTRLVQAYELSFLNKYLKGQDDHFLDGPPGERFPRVINFKKK